ncbi:NAD(P)/FAD-dependent oxidoreductase [Mesorhizobium amorphae]|uniref:FAD-dependent pyridine nucleotide-disulfide oxidoreductase n=1 Tax=Mesorhizobium amorphae CCNWGS0123 TaxID=1082933 RepID=G6Y2I3_9HYPH|nr:FAD-dependent oxidoreductase [Mesorhizobium amorphae]ANT54528.1 pyridine nucleotide-disulfide oxidoreductase [Mesorhizobium amorphae CCNWGS0123]EHH14033.1 FAD-dependent pyridine nucleotide-disulfide oxidoreductase [Mesorhizobium amorphae CCNWGS0123]
MAGIVIIGAGQAGASVAAKARVLGFSGQVTIIGDEPVAPYQRPPLSKGYLIGETNFERLLLRSPSFWSENGIDLKLGAPASAIDRFAKTVRCCDETVRYDQLVLATGSSPRRLPAQVGGQLGGVYTFRTVADANAMTAEFSPGRKLLIVGGGYIGLEAAALGAKLGLDVTLIEMAPRILQRVAAPATSDFFRALHAEHGVTILENIGLGRLIGEGRVSRALLSDGTELEVDFVIVGIGIAPRTQLASEAGLVIDNGVATDAFGRTSDPSIWAAGECASFRHGGSRIRLESVGHAIDHGELVARNIAGAAVRYKAQPWFWSDQYNAKLQIAGLNVGHDRFVVREGEGPSQSVWYYRGPQLLALDAMNDSRSYMVGKRIIETGQTILPEFVSDTSKDVKSLLSLATTITETFAA